MKDTPSPREQTCYRYRFGTAEFDEATYELRVAGLRVEVERRALEVLACLLRHAGEVVTKEELFAEVWAGRVTVDKVLPNAIAKLRRALGEANAELLTTQARIGYRLSGLIERVAIGRTLPNPLALRAGQPVPGRENFILRRQLGGHHDSEVWLAEHAKTHERRVYKFAVGDDRLKALKREATLARVLQESLEGPRPFVDLIDWNFESTPFFLECGYGGESLQAWAEHALAALPTDERLALFLDVADAVAAAHAVGVLHKDLKPANVLVETDGDRRRVRLTDFGSGRMLDPDRIDELGITRFGLSATQHLAADSSSGTPLYLAPEVFAGHASTVRSDVYALGVMLYQLIAGQIAKPMASGWEQDVDDPLLREDIAQATHGDPAQRIGSAAELAARLRALPARHAALRRSREAEAEAAREREALARSRARRPYLIALVAVLVAGVVSALALYRAAVQARDQAQRELASAVAINRFLNEDLISRANPLVVAKGQGATLQDVLIGARDRIAGRFAEQPLVEASIRSSLSALFNTIERLPDAEDEARRALALYEREEGAASLDALKARGALIRLLTRTAKFDECLRELQTFDRLLAGSTEPYAAYLHAHAWAVYHMNRGDYAKALPEYRKAIPVLAELEPHNRILRDSLRMDLIGALTQTRQLDEARREGEALIAEMRGRGDENGLAIAFTRAAVARAWSLEGDFDTARNQLLEAQKTIVALLGPEHTRNLMVQSDLFDIAMRRQDWPAALDYAQRVHEGFRAKFGEDHNISDATLANWGQALYESGDAAGAYARLAPAQRRLAERLSADNPQAQIAAFCTAAAAIESGRLDAAEAILATLKTDALEAGGADGLWAYRLDALRGLLAAARGQRDRADVALRSALLGVEGHDEPTGRVFESARRALAGGAAANGASAPAAHAAQSPLSRKSPP
ncbi:MAG TPA: winged helix-turn-helix domain-containing protein [Dokdonella sp.]|uniref:protein kinase domain-containing protein n=1 Tax=Dokdonella sp. TaxID=2291710 RepID=UPI002BF00D90|nr:winged helix-turn-helix domain-containing protein [Dokdonella sp.]HUD41494.1 winged helix-turn-helix domain-containing protein [Dokdonella sp.]